MPFPTPKVYCVGRRPSSRRWRSIYLLLYIPLTLHTPYVFGSSVAAWVFFTLYYLGESRPNTVGRPETKICKRGLKTVEGANLQGIASTTQSNVADHQSLFTLPPPLLFTFLCSARVLVKCYSHAISNVFNSCARWKKRPNYRELQFLCTTTANY